MVLFSRAQMVSSLNSRKVQAESNSSTDNSNSQVRSQQVIGNHQPDTALSSLIQDQEEELILLRLQLQRQQQQATLLSHGEFPQLPQCAHYTVSNNNVSSAGGGGPALSSAIREAYILNRIRQLNALQVERNSIVGGRYLLNNLDYYRGAGARGPPSAPHFSSPCLTRGGTTTSPTSPVLSSTIDLSSGMIPPSSSNPVVGAHVHGGPHANLDIRFAGGGGDRPRFQLPVQQQVVFPATVAGPRGGRSRTPPHRTAASVAKNYSRPKHYLCRPVMPLTVESDEAWLSPFLCFIRKECLEVFEAEQCDVYERKTSKQVVLHQVGVRCRFCAHLEHGEREQRSSMFPSKIDGIYTSLPVLIRNHLSVCPKMPKELRSTYRSLKGSSKRDGLETKSYWRDSAQTLGLVEGAQGGIFFNWRQRNQPPSYASSC